MTESSAVKSFPTMLPPRAAAEKTGLPEHLIRQLIKREKIVYVKAGNKFLVNIDKLADYLNNGDATR